MPLTSYVLVSVRPVLPEIVVLNPDADHPLGKFHSA
jgi:hypothetical protein